MTGSYGTEEGAFKILRPYGRNGSAVKVFPTTADFADRDDRPYVEYAFQTGKEADYSLTFEMAPTTPSVFEPVQYIGFSLNGGEVQKINTVLQPERPFYNSPQWYREAMDAVKKTETVIHCTEGINTIRFYGMSPSIVLERIVLVREDAVLPESYLGPKESFIQI